MWQDCNQSLNKNLAARSVDNKTRASSPSSGCKSVLTLSTSIFTGGGRPLHHQPSTSGTMLEHSMCSESERSDQHIPCHHKADPETRSRAQQIPCEKRSTKCTPAPYRVPKTRRSSKAWRQLHASGMNIDTMPLRDWPKILPS